MEEPEKPVKEEPEVNSEQEQGLAFNASRVKEEVETIHLLPSADLRLPPQCTSMPSRPAARPESYTLSWPVSWIP